MTNSSIKIPLVDLKAQYQSIRQEVNESIERVLENTSFIMGEEVKIFEASFANYINTGESLGVASGTAALLLALKACDVGPGDEVITTAHTFFATAEPISILGATPIFVDIDPLTYNINPNLIEAKITERTKAIIPVHLYGQPADMPQIMKIAKKHNLYVIEDVAQAHGAEIDGQRCGSIGHLSCFSFYPGKNLGAYGDGGGVSGTNTELLATVRKLRDHGRVSKYEHDIIGLGERLDGLQAAILDVKLKYLEEWTEARRTVADKYVERLTGVDGVFLPHETQNVRHVYHLFVIQVENRNATLKYLNENAIGAGIHYPIPLHKQPAYAKLGYDKQYLPYTETAADKILSLPMFPEITDQQIDRVVQTLKEALDKC